MSCHFSSSSLGHPVAASSSSSSSTNGSTSSSSCSCVNQHGKCVQRISSLEKQLQYQQTWIKVMGDWIQQKFGFDIQLIVGMNLDADDLFQDNKIHNGKRQLYHHNNNNNNKLFKNNNIQKLNDMDFPGRATTTTTTSTTNDTIPIHTNLNNINNTNSNTTATTNGFMYKTTTKNSSLSIPPHFSTTLFDSSSTCSQNSINNNIIGNNNNNNNQQITISTKSNNIISTSSSSSSHSSNNHFVVNGSPSSSSKIKTIVTFGNKSKNNINCSSDDSKHFEHVNNRGVVTKKRKFEDFEHDESVQDRASSSTSTKLMIKCPSVSNVNGLNSDEEQEMSNVVVGHNSNYAQAASGKIFESVNVKLQDSSHNQHQQNESMVQIPISEFTAAEIPIKMEVEVSEEISDEEEDDEEEEDSTVMIHTNSNNNNCENIANSEGMTGQQELEQPIQVNTQEIVNPSIQNEMTSEELDEEGFQVIQIDEEEIEDEDEEIEETNQLEEGISQEDEGTQDIHLNPAFVKVVATKDGQLVQIIHENDPDIDIKYDPFNQLTFEAAETESQQQRGEEEEEEENVVGNTNNNNNNNDNLSHQELLPNVDSGVMTETDEERTREEDEEDHDVNLVGNHNHLNAFDQYYDESIEEDDEIEGRIGTVVVSAARLESRGIVEPNEANSSNDEGEDEEEEEEAEDEDEEAPELDLEEPHKLQTYNQQQTTTTRPPQQGSLKNRVLHQNHRHQQIPKGNRRKAFIPTPQPPVIRHQRLMPMNHYEKLVDRLKLTNSAIKSSRFDFLWILQMKAYQLETLPFHMFIKRDDVRFWVEYLPNKRNPKLSRYRCRICVKHFRYPDGTKCTREGALESPHGQLKPTAEENRSVLTCHAKKKTHRIICEQLELEQDPDAKYIELDPDLKKQLVEALKKSDGPTTTKTSGIIIS